MIWALMRVSAGKEQSERRVGRIVQSISSCFLSSLLDARAGFLLSYVTDGGKSHSADHCSLPALNAFIIEERQRVMIFRLSYSLSQNSCIITVAVVTQGGFKAGGRVAAAKVLHFTTCERVLFCCRMDKKIWTDCLLSVCKDVTTSCK